MGTQLKILITGAAGNLGTKLRHHLNSQNGRYHLTLIDKEPQAQKGIIKIDLSQWHSSFADLFKDIDVVVHLAANPNPRESWADLVGSNLDATINTFIAAANAKVKRVIYASSNHVMGGYKDQKVSSLTTNLPPLPGTSFSFKGVQYLSTPYAAMKLFGERLGKCYAETNNMSVVAVRIGWTPDGENSANALPPGRDPWFHHMWLSNKDFCHLMECCIHAELSDSFVVVNGMSANNPMIWDIEQTKTLIGYIPSDGLNLNGSDLS